MKLEHVRTLRRSIAAIVVVTAALVTAPAGAQEQSEASPVAPGGFGFSVRPYAADENARRDYFEVELQPGDGIGDHVAITNTTGEDKTFKLYARDAFNTSLGGGFALQLQEEAPTDAGGWVALPVADVAIPAHQMAIVPISIGVPRDAEPGDHSAGIIAELVKPPAESSGEGAGLQTIERVAARVYVRVAGATNPQLQVTTLEVDDNQPLLPFITGRGDMTVDFTVANTGNVRVELEDVTLEITGVFGRSVEKFTLTPARPDDAQSQVAPELPDVLLPGNELLFRRVLDELPPIDILNVKVVVNGHDPTTDEPVTASASKRVLVIPWLLLLILAAIVALFFAFRWWRRRRKPRAPEAPPTEERELVSA